MNAIEVENLEKRYGPTRAVDGLSFSIEEGEIFGMVGPNGAGKTTTIECLEGLRKPTDGKVRVFGIDPSADRNGLYRIAGVQLQETSYQDKIKVWEICKLFSSFYENPVPYEDLLRKFSLFEMKKKYVSTLSGGQRQRISIVLALIPNPRVIFLDELTTGLDPQARHTMWGLIKDLKKDGKTVFLTTHYMEEAERLCDRVAIIDHGKILALDTPKALVKSIDVEERVVFDSESAGLERLENVEGVRKITREDEKITVFGKGGDFLANVAVFLKNEGIEYGDLRFEKPDLEDVFLKLTGKNIRD